MGSQQSFHLNVAKTAFDPSTSTWSALNTPVLYHENVSVGNVCIKALSKNPQDVAQVCHEDDHQMKNWEILRDSVRVCLNLRDLGLREGEVLGLVARNGRNIASVIFGAWLNGTAVTTLDPSFDSKDIAHGFGISEPKLVVCDKENYLQVKKALKCIENPAPTFIFDSEEESLNLEAQSVRELLKEHPQELDFV